MIIWSGFGFLVAVFVFGAAILCNLLFDAQFGAEYYSSHKWTIGVAMFLGALPCWLLGSYLRKRQTKTVVDKLTGQEMFVQRASHSLFFIPMHIWAPILVVIGIVLCVMEFIK